jgi:ribonuclease HI
MNVTIYTDGGARGNPGPAAIGILILDDNNSVLFEHAETIGKTTNNVAEYTALNKALKEAKQFSPKTVSCFSDSELLVKQMKGEYNVKNADLRVLHRSANEKATEFKKVSYTHVPRSNEFITKVDALLNEALDAQ